MRRTTRIAEARRTGARFAAHGSKVVLCALLLCCSGCFRHKTAVEDGFRLTDNGGAPMLVPISGQSSDPGNFQTSTLFLPGGSASAKDQVSRRCTIDGEIFSLRLASPPDSRHWIVRSPSVAGWNTLASKINIGLQWKDFTRGVARMSEEGCFPSGLSALQIRAAIAQRIPLPGDEVPLFFYSDQGINFIDLAPGMEVRLQQFLSPGTTVSGQPAGPARMLVANYEVIPRRGEGVRLKLTPKIENVQNGGSGPELLSLSQRFAQTAVLRLFLEGDYGKGQVSDGILIGASNQTQLDALTDLIHQGDPAKCVNYQGTVCIEFSPGELSLYSTVWVNGHQTSCVFGTSLAVLSRCQPRPEQMMTVESAQVFRRVHPDHYAEILFPRTESGASELLLLPGDRIEWRH